MIYNAIIYDKTINNHIDINIIKIPVKKLKDKKIYVAK